MSHLLHEVKEELDWAARELAHVERQFAALEAKLKGQIDAGGANLQDLRHQVEEQKRALNMDELYAILSRAARRFSLLSRVLEIGATHFATEDIVTQLTDGSLFRQSDIGEIADGAILKLADALQHYFHVHFGDESDMRMRNAWLEVENTLRTLGRKI